MILCLVAFLLFTTLYLCHTLFVIRALIISPVASDVRDHPTGHDT